MKKLLYFGDACQRYKALPPQVTAVAGYELYRVQIGLEPRDWKPMPIIGPGAAEIRIRDVSGAYRVFYVARFPEAVYVLHAIQKKTEQTPKADIDFARRCYRSLVAQLKG